VKTGIRMDLKGGIETSNSEHDDSIQCNTSIGLEERIQNQRNK
jgi:hypothetical protein